MRICLVFLFCVFSIHLYAVEPIKKYIDHPGNSSFKFEALEIKTKDDFALKTWITFPTTENDLHRTLILAYGDSGNMSYYVRQVLEVVNQGYTVVMFDYRGFGESQAFEVSKDTLYYDAFTTDLQAVLDYTKKRFDTPIGIWALSMGTIYAVELYSMDTYDYLIAEGFVSNPKKVVEVVKEHLNRDLLIPDSVDKYELALSKLTLPVLFFAGDRDGLTSPEASYRAKYLNEKNEVVLFKGGHLQGFQALSDEYHGQRYIEAINAFYVSVFP
ncbi:alpha/beta hydrolase [Myroides pelagicus]|uniref:Peptidase n=1 Tax=Myroides pelagicus TaxID=270914 RepID=A0A7K1GNS6_9FLAO|nr:alpha/beta hydrolase [Myroides pelagicus]MEC4114575.1 alpha/beta hydrolase [Myroides pelagicus]MTH30199.1 peptidase [Myroides pelagicus]